MVMLTPCWIPATMACSGSSIKRTSRRWASSVSWREATSCPYNLDRKVMKRSQAMGTNRNDIAEMILTHDRGQGIDGYCLHGSDLPF